MEKKLYKSRTDRRICGVCGGIAKYLECDSTIVRLMTVLLTITFGAGLIMYIAAALIMPYDPAE